MKTLHRLVMDNPFYVICDPDGAALCWVPTESEDDAWDYFNEGFAPSHLDIDWTGLDDDMDEIEFLKSKGYRAVDCVLCARDVAQ